MRIALIMIVLVAPGCGHVVMTTDAGNEASDGPAGDAAPASSCGSLPLTCGPLGASSCCASGTVTGGTFLRSYDVAADMMFQDTTHPATVSTFRLDTYEVTVGRFRQFLAAGQGTRANPPIAGAGARALNGMMSQGGWDPAWNANLVADQAALIAAVSCDATYETWTDAPGTDENLPMVCITWYEAMAFCAWDGGFLPTEAELMYAASGGAQQRAYPWSSPAGSTTVDCTTANHGGTNWPITACVAAGASEVGTLSPAGDGAFGQADLGGNVWEWVLDWASLLSSDCTDCANLVPASDRLIRGGSYMDDALAVRAAARFYGVPPPSRYGIVGTRCARAGA